LFYLRHSSPWLDFRIYLATALHLISAPVSLRRALLMLPHGEELLVQAEASGTDSPEFEMHLMIAGNNRQ
jgi:hypothetical protein